MRSEIFKSVSSITALAALTAAIPIAAFAEMSEDEYRAALKIASEEVQRRAQLSEGRAGAISAAVLRELFGRYYEKGDSWVVAASREDSPMARMTGDPARLAAVTGQIGVFRYEVARVKTGIRPEVDLEVRQIVGYGITE